MEQYIHDFFREMTQKPLEENVFVSENDLVLNIGYFLKTKFPTCKINFEYPFRLKYERQDETVGEEPKEGWSYLDFSLSHEGKKYGFEIKYLTSKIELDFIQKGFHLKDQGAQDLLRFNFRKDIYRLEVLKNRGELDHGFAILVTNDATLINTNTKKITLDFDFKFSNDKKIKGGVAFWKKKPGKESKWLQKKSTNISLTLKSEGYPFRWHDYLILPNQKNGEFKYAIIAV